MLCAYADLSNSIQNIYNKIFKELCHKWLASAKQHISDKLGNGKTTIAITSPKSKDLGERYSTSFIYVGYSEPKEMLSGCYILSGSNKPIKVCTMQNHFREVLKDCGVCSTNFHLLRHIYTAVCIESGFDAKTVNELLGHWNVSITLNRCVHFFAE